MSLAEPATIETVNVPSKASSGSTETVLRHSAAGNRGGGAALQTETSSASKPVHRFAELYRNIEWTAADRTSWTCDS